MRTIKTRSYSGTKSNEPTARELTNRQLARRAATEGIVLLRNEDGLLPLAKGSKLALYGRGASKTIKGGTGSGDVNERSSVSVYEGLVNAGYDVTTKDWIEAYDAAFEQARLDWRDKILTQMIGKDPVIDFFDIYNATPCEIPTGGPITQTDAEVALYVLSRVAGEGLDRFDSKGDYYLTDVEHEQIAQISALYRKVVLIINTGGPVDLAFADEFTNIAAILYLSQAGMEGGNALADIISGDVTPSGRLASTWALEYKDYPNSATFSHNNGNVNEEPYTEGLYVGYRYFDSYQVPVRYGFGDGLSYAKFDLTVTSVSLTETQAAEVDVKVTNISDQYSGKEIVQIYATCPEGTLDKEYRRLVGFAKTGLLAPSAGETLTITVPLNQLTSYDETVPGYVLESGAYVLWAGSSLANAQPLAVLTLDETAVVTRTTNICPLQEELDELHQDPAQRAERLAALLAETADLPHLALQAAAIETRVVEYKKNTELVPEEARAFVDTLTMEQTVALATGDPGKGQSSFLGQAGTSVPGSAGDTSTAAMDKGIPPIVLADGPAGVRLQRTYEVRDGAVVSEPFMSSIEGGLFKQDSGNAEDEIYYQYCTAIPVGTLLAQTWDLPLIEEVGAMIGGEMEEFGVTLWLAPGMNIHRNPLCGRNFEYYSEDPLVSGRMAGAMTRGVQTVPGVGTTIKHYCANNQEDNRLHSNSILSERVLREIYLRGFEICVTETQPMSIMTSYNLINGVHAANCEDTCTKVARCEWGFQGMIMTDWTTTMHGEDCTAAGCMRAGNDVVMPGAMSDRENLNAELASGALPVEDLKACISRIVNIVWQSNQYEEAVPYQKMQ